MFAEDLRELAAYEFAVARDRCMACDDYHALWGYLRLARVTSRSFETERDILEPLLREHAGTGARVLIAGAADAGLLALVLDAVSPRTQAISVADRCPTRLAVCRDYAAAHGLAVAATALDLTEAAPGGRYDVALSHNMLMLQPLDRHVPLLANLRRALDPGGALILVNRVKPGTPETPPSPVRFADRILEALSALSVALPEPEDEFRERLERYAVVQRRWSDAVIDSTHVESALAAAGFIIARRIDHDRRRTAPDRDGGVARPMETNIYVARPGTAR